MCLGCVAPKDVTGDASGLTVANRAVSGSSARSFAREGYVYNIVQVLQGCEWSMAIEWVLDEYANASLFYHRCRSRG